MSSITTKKSFPWPTDSDSHERDCTIQLMVRDIVDGRAEHWALYFEWTDHVSATYEAFDKNGYLIPTWNRGKPGESYEWRVEQSSEKLCSPKEVNSVARQIALNGRSYILTSRNCHHWAIALAREFGMWISGPPENSWDRGYRAVVDMMYCVKGSIQLLGLSTASIPGAAPAVVSTGSRIVGTSLDASKVIAETLTDPPSDHHSAKETSHVRNSKATFASSSQGHVSQNDD